MRYVDRVGALLAANAKHLCYKEGVASVKAIQMMSIVELRHRIALSELGERITVKAPEDARGLLVPEMTERDMIVYTCSYSTQLMFAMAPATPP